MSHHECPRCGVPLKWTHRAWADKHPAAAVTAGLVSLVFMGMMLSVHPVAAAVMLVIAAAWAAVRAVGRARDRKRALAARADYEFRNGAPGADAVAQYVAQFNDDATRLAGETVIPPQLWPRAVNAPTPRRRPADHWSLTEPMARR